MKPYFEKMTSFGSELKNGKINQQREENFKALKSIEAKVKA